MPDVDAPAPASAAESVIPLHPHNAPLQILLELGIVGALLSVPIASAIKIVCENIEALRPISIMMGSGKAYRHEFNGAAEEAA